MFKKTATALVVLSLPLTVAANNWSAGIGYLNLSDDSNNIDITLGGLYGSVAYKYQTEHKKISILPEFRLGTGFSDDSERLYGNKFDVELERFMSLSVKGQYDVTEQLYVYVMPSYANAKLKVSGRGYSESDDEWEFGVGTGLGYQLNEKADVVFSYEKYDDTDVLTAGFNFKF